MYVSIPITLHFQHLKYVYPKTDVLGRFKIVYSVFNDAFSVAYTI